MAATPFALPKETVEYIMGMAEASQAQFQELRKLRNVSHLFCECADERMHHPAWNADFLRQAREFRDDLLPGGVLAVGTAPNAGLRRMLRTGHFEELSAGMCTYLADEFTQETIIRLLLDYVNEPAKRYRNLATSADMHRMVAQTLRFHTTNQNVVRNACEILGCLFTTKTLSHEAVMYIVAILVFVIQNNMTDTAVILNCVSTIQRVMPRTGGVPFLMVGENNMLTVMCQIMQNCSLNLTIINEATLLMRRFIEHVNIATDDTHMRAFDVPMAEHILLHAMQRYFSHAGIQWHILSALTIFSNKYGVRLRQQQLTVDLTLKAMVSHSNADKIIVSAFENLTAVAPFCVEAGRTSIDASLIIPLGIAALCFMQVNVQSKNKCTVFVHLLQILCRNHLANTQCAIHYNVTSLLYQKFSMYTDPHFGGFASPSTAREPMFVGFF